MRYSLCPSPFGELLLVINTHGLVYASFQHGERPRAIDSSWRHDPVALAPYQQQCEAYFAKQLTQFDLPLAPQGTVFQRTVWQALQQIPYGQTWSYSALAEHIGNPQAARAVGMANRLNPLALIVPCHRVIGKNHQLTGYWGGLALKQALLTFEGAVNSTPAV